MKDRKKKRRKKQARHKKVHCMDCGEPLSPELTAEIEEMKQSLEMPNMLTFCDNCHFKFKNRLRRVWNGFKYLFK